MLCFVDSTHSVNKVEMRSQTVIIIFINEARIHWHSKQQLLVRDNTFGAEVCAMKVGVKMIKDLQYNLRMFGFTIDGSENVYL